MRHNKFQSSSSQRCFALLLSLFCFKVANANNNLGHKAIPPKMDPRPTLPPVTHRVYLDVEIDNKNAGRIILGLFGTVAPKTVENFRALCACDTGDENLCYKGSEFHRVIPNFAIQAGDIVRGDGTGGASIYNDGGTFEDEEFKVTFNRKFLVAMANNGPDTNASQFFITTVKAQWLTGKNVVFGKVIDGSENVVKAIEKQGTNGGTPRAKIVIVDAGVLEVTENYDDDRDPHHNQDLPDDYVREGVLDKAAGDDEEEQE